MPDMKEAMREAGIHVSPDDRRGRSGGSREDHRADNPFPQGYPRYFTSEGNTRIELLKEEAEKIAERFAADRLTRHQLRAFYDHAKRQSERLRYGASFGQIHPEIVRLKPLANDRAERGSIPRSFKQFIDRNIDALTDQKSFSEGFMPHFEAVVAYSRTGD